MKKTALYQEHIDLGAKMVEFAGFSMPVSYTSIKSEHLAVRNSVGMFDVSHMGEFVVKGPDAEAFLQWVCSNDISKMKDMQCQYNCFPNDTGGIVDDLIVYRWDATEYNLVVNAANIDKDLIWLKKQLAEKGFNASIEDISDSLSLIAVQGPEASKLVDELSDVDCSAIAFYHFNAGTVAGIDDVVISNTGYTGSGGFELYVWNKDASELWKKLLKAGKEYNIQACGLASRDTLRLEKGYCLYGNDIDDSTSPIEAGLGWITKFSKDFVHKSYHERLKSEGVSKKLVGFILEGKGIPRKGYPIVNAEGEAIGEVTSGTQSPSLDQAIGMGYVAISHAKVGQTIHIEQRNKQIPAKIVKMPFL